LQKSVLIISNCYPDKNLIFWIFTRPSILSSDIADGTIDSIDISNNSISYSKIVNGAIYASKLAGRSVSLTNGSYGQALISNAEGTFSWGTGGTDFSQNIVTAGSNSHAFTLTRPANNSGSGTNFSIKAQDASGTNQDCGNITLIPGSSTGNGNEGEIVIGKTSSM